MVKQKISITLDKETLNLIEKALKKADKTKGFRNRSHVIEFMLNKSLKEEKK